MTDVKDDIDLSTLNQLEADFYSSGYEAGFEHGKLHGIFEGRAMGQENGFEIWEELGYYRGQAEFWSAVIQADDSKKRALQNITQLISLIDKYPANNDSNAATSPERDLEALMLSIRSKYRVMCASLSIRPRLQKAVLSM